VATLCYKNEIIVLKIFSFNIFSTPETPKSLKVKIKNSNIMNIYTYILLNYLVMLTKKEKKSET
jgi:hypothetical protein